MGSEWYSLSLQAEFRLTICPFHIRRPPALLDQIPRSHDPTLEFGLNPTLDLRVQRPDRPLSPRVRRRNVYLPLLRSWSKRHRLQPAWRIK
ncbi:hypothetical protein P175DRAFT_0110519 [Aspergillus ochraceoroseus IBT 24754]|uniref:Uncharacterized protein n=1 Tax=Aspergillus ochraceoroseus IBT 24754 TaxID=1392256 RepID=A0A2T5LL86_9EURO|nr:uncharacterized protein P175DRAFT_0110519 [Aspergillus ochraceoroseus IBT 24754]PTU17046.1 hypothetical protein P175DRAFT_0110519 [Aspergillus ochraceoroseus IBT 24754]